MSDDGFLTGLIGRQTSRATVVVERGPVSHFATAVFDDDPIYRDASVAAAAGFAGIPTTATFPMALRYWGAFEELQPAPAERGEGIQSVIDLLKQRGGLILHGEQSFHSYRPILVGDRLEGIGTIIDAYAKETKGRTMTFVVEETLWRDTLGEPVCATRFNVIHRL